MRPSRLAQRKLNPKTPSPKPKKINFFSFGIALLISTFALTVIIYILSLSSIWDAKSKFVVANQSSNGDISLEIYDPANSGITLIKIPSATQVDAANQLGSWKLGSIPKLGSDKSLGPNFLKNTIIKSFAFPIDSSSNLPLIDKIKIKLFTLSVGNAGRLTLDLSKTNYLNDARLPDGSNGFEIADNIPANVESYFSENFSNNANVFINNQTGSVGEGVLVGKILSVLGANVTSVQNADTREFNCKIIGLDKNIIKRIGQVLSCDTSIQKPENNFDIEVDLGKTFKNRF